jgi:hypothetical protein
MKRSTFNFLIDLLSLVVLLALVWTGLVIYYVLPPCGNCDGTGCAVLEARTLWGLGRHDFGRIHFCLALATVGLIMLHLCLHWSWLCVTFCSLVGMKKATSSDRTNLYGAVILLLLVMLVIALLYLAKMQVR